MESSIKELQALYTESEIDEFLLLYQELKLNV